MHGVEKKAEDARKRIEGLHGLYVGLTGLQLRLDMQREQEWFWWLQRGFTEEDLRLVVGHLKRGIAAGKRNPGALKFSNLIVPVDYFEEDLAEARARTRAHNTRPDVGKAEVLRATGRGEQGGGDADGLRTAGEVLAGVKLEEALRKLKDELRVDARAAPGQ